MVEQLEAKIPLMLHINFLFIGTEKMFDDIIWELKCD